MSSSRPSASSALAGRSWPDGRGGEWVTGEESTLAEERVSEETAVVEDGDAPATTVESVEPGVADEPAVDTSPADMGIPLPTVADEGEEKGT